MTDHFIWHNPFATAPLDVLVQGHTAGPVTWTAAVDHWHPTLMPGSRVVSQPFPTIPDEAVS